MKRIYLLALLAIPAWFAFSSDTETAVPITNSYMVDTRTSVLTWLGEPLFGDSHTGTLKLSAGTLSVVNNQLIGGNFTIDMNSLNNADGETYSDGLVGHLRAEDFFDVANHPTAKFVIIKVTPKTSNASATHDIAGNLTIKGITNELTFPAKVTLDGKSLSATADLTFDRSLYDVRYGSQTLSFMNLGNSAIKDIVGLKVSLKATAVY